MIIRAAAAAEQLTSVDEVGISEPGMIDIMNDARKQCG